jgi:hypothetical protein
MFGVDSDIGNSALRLWVAAGSAALLVFVCAQAFDWTRSRRFARISVVVLGAVLGACLAWAFLDAASVRDQNAERRALETRAAELNARILAPGSPLACLDGAAGANVESACEKALFAAPVTVAAATSYVTARLALLADMVAYTKRGGANVDSALLPLRHSLETDRFGFVAHVLAVRDGCSSDHCTALALLHDPSQVRANLSGQTLDRYLDHYLPVWAQSPDVPLADASPPQSSATAQAGVSGQKKVVVDIDFPTADSIPPVSIMNPEPKGPVTATAPAAVAAGAATKSTTSADANISSMPSPPTKQHPHKQAANAPGPANVPAPAPTADPVWGPGTAKPQAATVPVQLNPAPSPPEASAGTMRTQ